MPIRLRMARSKLMHRDVPIRSESNARAGNGPLLAICMCLCLQTSSGVLASQATSPQPAAAPVAPQPPLETALRDALQQYSAALESLNAEQVKKIHPSVDSEGLKRAFREMRELKVTIDTIKVLSTEGTTARVSCRVTQTLTPRAGTKQNNTVTRVMRLRRQDSAWVIDGFER